MIEDATDIVCDTGPIIHLDELGCLDLLADFKEILLTVSVVAENYPRGALNVRRKQNRGKGCVYYYLVRRDGKKDINRHISEKELPELQKLIEEREKCRKEIRAYKKRMAYLEKLLNKPNPGGGRHESAAR